jgi:D-glycero-D-manno-heptose 1,7-bisphosphate phosphatase
MLIKKLKPKKLVLLDRDGVINFDSDEYIKSPEEWIPIPGSLDAIAAFNKAGIDVCIITNQSGLGRNLFSKKTLDAMHAKMDSLLADAGGKILRVYFCPHLPVDQCACRKPNTGMLDTLENEFSISLNNVPFIGDSGKDLELAHRKHCLPILVKTGKGAEYFETKLHLSPWAKSCLVFDDLKGASNYLINHYF